MGGGRILFPVLLSSSLQYCGVSNGLGICGCVPADDFGDELRRFHGAGYQHRRLRFGSVAEPVWFLDTGDFVMHGGVVHRCQRTAFNLCNFSVAHPDMARDDPWEDSGTALWSFCPSALSGSQQVSSTTVNGVLLHEASHTLNVAAFGWIYHLVGALDFCKY